YTLATFFNYHLKQYPGMDFKIIGTDIDKESIKVAQNGVYRYSEIKSIPSVYIKDNWQKGTGVISHFVKIKKHIKEKCTFKEMNLIHPEPIQNEKFDVIFCRNVFIYFKSELIHKIVNNFKNKLHKRGLLFTGLSESLNSLEINKITLAPSVYSFDRHSPIPSIKSEPILQDPIKKSIIPNPIRVLAVDDSSSILKLLTKVFNDDKDFLLVGTAKNGIEAAEFLKTNKVDAMTLDIHMPEMDGVEYLKQHFTKDHPNVVVISSASREDARYAQKTLKYGALDFVEKPALNNLIERAEEIKSKIKMSFLNSTSSLSNIDESFNKNFVINDPESKIRIFLANYSDKEKLKKTIASFKGNQPPIGIFFQGNENYLDIIKDEFNWSQNIEVFDKDIKLECNKIYLCDLSVHFDSFKTHIENYKKSISVFGYLNDIIASKIFSLNQTQILVEDANDPKLEYQNKINDIFPWTSVAHVGTEYLAKD
ncbi:MAG: response regulator, partial [Bdellovibrionales bacterium]|nr:response regulator [Bdellovibrionales bacterium]